MGTFALIVRVASDGAAPAGFAACPVEVIVHFASKSSYTPPQVTLPVAYGDVRVARRFGSVGSFCGMFERTASAS
jgi:hypothetical protein